MKFEKKEIIQMVKIALCLLAIAAVCTLLVAVVNDITTEPILEQRRLKVEAAMNEILVAEKYEAVDLTDKGLGEDVLEIYTAYKGNDKIGYCVKTTSNGYGGAIEIMTGVGLDGAVTGVKIVNMSETAGLGTKTSDAAWLAQYVGKGSDVAVSKSFEPEDNEISAVSGATVSSKAVTKGVAAAVSAACQVEATAQGVVEEVPAEETPVDDAAAQVKEAE